MAMNDEEVRKQLTQMVNFILKEANEKAKEIQVKAEEEFNIEKQRIVQAERVKITKEYERKEKQVEVKRKIAHSNELNNARIEVLKSREEQVANILHEAFKRLSSISQAGDYKELLRKLIVQAALKIDEPKVSVLCREADRHLVEQVLDSAAKEASAKLKKNIDLSIDATHLHKESAGGVVLAANNGKILCNNTLEQRLHLAYEGQLPTIRTSLFGKSQSRKFFE
eukprot:TRINITY_DN3768_c0_g1_i1.p1 TRINITY_DN3768_c0_g1~~TRINITY_DN3768_c0_g1_i1.p1  ORF type:complete len:225 (+),score=82.93 TRINITY_DN3768_c0_g1_i1:87-761(+)